MNLTLDENYLFWYARFYARAFDLDWYGLRSTMDAVARSVVFDMPPPARKARSPK